jgi:hypothetical protein
MSDQAVTMASIDTPPLTVTVQAPGITLDEASAAALALYRSVYDPSMAKTPGAVGFVAERSGE